MPGITPGRWLPLVVIQGVFTPFLHATKLQKISETTKHFSNFFRYIFKKSPTTEFHPIVRPFLSTSDFPTF